MLASDTQDAARVAAQGQVFDSLVLPEAMVDRGYACRHRVCARAHSTLARSTCQPLFGYPFGCFSTRRSLRLTTLWVRGGETGGESQRSVEGARLRMSCESCDMHTVVGCRVSLASSQGEKRQRALGEEGLQANTGTFSEKQGRFAR